MKLTTQTLQVFDPAMCCSTGVCGPEVDTKLVQFAADLDWLKTQDVIVQRHNLSQNPAAFVENETVQSHADGKGRSRAAGDSAQRQGGGDGPLSRPRRTGRLVQIESHGTSAPAKSDCCCGGGTC